MNINHRTSGKSCLQKYILSFLTGRGWGMGLLLLCLFNLAACSSDSDDNGSKGAAYTVTTQTAIPAWQIDWTNNQAQPNWTEPNSSIYENWVIMKVKIEEELLPFVSAGDMMALFVNGELRGLAKPAIVMGGGKTGSSTFLMKAYGNESDTETVNMALLYYNQNLNHIFALSETITFSSDVSTGFDKDFIPEFTKGSPKYPVVKTLTAESLLTTAGITPAGGNIIAAFVGNECRGKATLSAQGGTQLVIYGRSAGESVTLKYFDSATDKLYTIADAVRM